MKQNKIVKVLASLLVCLLLAGTVGQIQVDAGSSDILLDKSSFEGKIDFSRWNNTDENVKSKNGALVFSKESNSATGLIVKTIAKNTGYHKNIVSMKSVMDLTNVPKGESFVLAFGLSSIEATTGEAGNVEVHFRNNGSLEVLVKEFDDDGNEKKILSPVKVSSVSNVSAEVVITAKQQLRLTVNGAQLCDKKLKVDGEGRVGFLQTGRCAVTVKDVEILSHKYERPENTNIKEDFEQGTINVNTLTARMVMLGREYTPFGMRVTEVDNNSVMQIQNASVTYLGTLHKYSNFEITFDVKNLVRKATLDKDGKITAPKSEVFGVSFGDEAPDYTGYGYETSTDMIVFSSGSNVYSLNEGNVVVATDKGYNFFNDDCDKDFTVRVSVIDGIATTSMKWINEKEFTEILSYRVSRENPLGYVHIWTSGQYNSMDIDNVSIINKDEDPNLIEVDYKSAIWEKPEDFKYEKITAVYRETVSEEKGFNMYYIIPMVAGLCVILFGCVVLVTNQKRKKEGIKGEK